MCFVILVARLFVPFDGAKLRRFFLLAMDFSILCAITGRFVDEYQKSAMILPIGRHQANSTPNHTLHSGRFLYSGRIQVVYRLYTKCIPAEYKLYSGRIQVVCGRNTSCIHFRYSGGMTPLTTLTPKKLSTCET